jgi:methionyl-tRNA formyltransferase
LKPDEGFKAIYFGRVLQESVDLLSEAVRQIREGTFRRTPQDNSLSSYNPPFGPEQWTINWEDNVQKIYNTIRACDAWPGAQTTLRGEPLVIWQAKLESEIGSKSPPGTILEVSDEAIMVSAGNGSLKVERIQWRGGPKFMASDFLKTYALEPGEVLGN